jgi:ribosomal protein S18 acetylase RimI-like enzyme
MHLYTKVGFVQVGCRKRYYADGVDALLLAKDL